MADDWERINEALGAEMAGKSLAPHVSRRTLFGIQSSVEAQMAQVAAEVASGGAGGSAEARELRGELAEFAQKLGSRLIVGRADRYYVHRAREAGYDIPAYPFARSGELADFLADEGVPDLPAWYGRLGAGERERANLAAYALVALRDARSDAWRERLVAGAAMYVDASRFEPLSDDALLERAPAPALRALLDAVRGLVARGHAQD